jgi:fucose permease
MGTNRRRRGGLVAVQVGLFVVLLGVPDGALGVVWPSIRHEFHRRVGDLGILALAGMVLYVVAGLVTGSLVRRIGFGAAISAAVALAAGTVGGWMLAPSWVIVVVAVAGFGLSRGIVDASVNAAVSMRQGVRSLGLLHAAYGVGATLGPVLAAVAVATWLGWRAAIGCMWALMVLLAVAVVMVRREWPAVTRLDTDGDHRDERPSPHGGLVPLTVLVFFAYTGVEGGTGAWAYTLMREGNHLSSVAAAAAVTLYWAGLSAGRFGLAIRGTRGADVSLLNAGAALAALALLVAWLGPAYSAVVALPLAGLGFAPVFPVLIALTPGRVGTHRATDVIGWSVSGAALGGPASTALLGVIANQAGVKSLGPSLLAAAVMFALLQGALSLLASRHSS